MSSGNLEETSLLRGDESMELIRLRRKLVELQTRLEEETAYYRAELEASRQHLERDNTLLLADEVGRRRRAEEQLAALESELQQAREQAADAERRNRALRNRLAELESAQSERQQPAGDAQAAASTAWREAEQELARQEQELAAARDRLATEQQTRQRLQAAATQQHAELQRARQAEQEAMRLVVSLKKALWATAQARRRAETELAALREETEPATEPALAVAEEAPGPRLQSGAYHELSRDTLQTVFFGDLNDELSDEFRLTASDASLDSETMDRLRAIAVPSSSTEPAAVVEQPAMPAPSVPTARSASADRAAAPMPAAQAKRRGYGLLVGLGLAALVAAVVYWLAATDRLGPYLAALLDALG